ncbi:MAG: hypothetical protein J0H43_14830 [Actinobacteria bacterium]|nr:hypothetical protein [Actinomycetota bacterium]
MLPKRYPDNAGLVVRYGTNGFLSTAGPNLRTYTKIATAHAYRAPHGTDHESIA